jgi:D-alanine-D-alanine ligase
LRTRIGLIFGGRSGEHEVSIRSAQSIAAALDKDKYDVVLIGIDKRGVWRLGDESRALLTGGGSPEESRISESAPALVPVVESGRALLRDPASGKVRTAIDVFFPIVHGTYGEDGSLQGFLRMLDVPFVGAGVLGSAVGMDKDVMKRLLRDAGLPIGAFLAVREAERRDVSYDEAARRLGAPFFVKSANMGSSVGVSKVRERAEFEPALDEAFLYDRKAVIEEFIPGREIECSVLGNDSPRASVPGEIVVNADFYSYEAKYINENGATLEIPARLDEETTRRVRDLAVAAFRALECAGMARVDLFLKDDGAILVNEINTLPGFTRISMYPKLWEASGLAYPRLLDELLGLAIEQHAKESKLKRSYGG